MKQIDSYVQDETKNMVNILVVDDDPDIIRLFSLRLPPLGYQVTTASSGEEALDLIRQVAPHIVLLDQEMPGLDGLNTFLSIKALWPELPVVMCTGHGSVELVRVFMLKGGQDFIQKPILDFETLDFRLRKILLDIDSKRKTQQELIAVSTKIETEAFKSSLLTSMSHELRTPLNHLMGFSQLLASGGEDQVGLSQKILEAAERLNTLVDKILATVTLEKGVESDLSVVNLSGLIEELCISFDKKIKKKGLTLRRDVPDVSVNADCQKLHQVLISLIENAIKFTDPGGEIRIYAWKEGNQTVVSVVDTGIGIAQRDLPRVFERFGKLDQQTGAKPGLGMGLYIAKKLVGLMGGEITVTSEPGKGSIFSVRLT
ncbi:MAG: hybrid sensor histidine kinase/response regulator [Candidatus Magnetobacterium sp. LHC-1]|nr:hybrid sensor histidine kinase/response regulator [Nitrospirota bacterium]